MDPVFLFYHIAEFYKVYEQEIKKYLVGISAYDTYLLIGS